MQADKIEELERAVRALERRNHRLTLSAAGLFALNVAIVLFILFSRGPAAAAPSRDQVLRVRGISVVDANGTERVRIGAPVPEPLILGKRFPRGGDMSGIILSDEEGNERSGYCTSDGYPNVLFTLDSIGVQQVLFLAEPQGDTAFWIWNGANSFKVNVGEEESSLNLSSGGKVVLGSPPAPQAGKGEKK